MTLLKVATAKLPVNLRTISNLVGLVIGQAAAEVGVAPGIGLAPGRRDQNFVLLHCQDALVGAHDLSHGFLEL